MLLNEYVTDRMVRKPTPLYPSFILNLSYGWMCNLQNWKCLSHYTIHQNYIHCVLFIFDNLDQTAPYNQYIWSPHHNNNVHNINWTAAASALTYKCCNFCRAATFWAGVLFNRAGSTLWQLKLIFLTLPKTRYIQIKIKKRILFQLPSQSFADVCHLSYWFLRKFCKIIPSFDENQLEVDL